MAEATNDRRTDKDRLRATRPPHGQRRPLEPDRDVENYRDEYDAHPKQRGQPAVGHRA